MQCHIGKFGRKLASTKQDNRRVPSNAAARVRLIGTVKRKGSGGN